MLRAIVRQSDNIEAVRVIEARRVFDITLRPLQETDVPALVDLWVASWQATLPTIDFEARRGWISDFLRAPAYMTLVAECDSAPAGFASLEGSILQQLAVATSLRGQGVATRLLDAAKTGRDGLTLDVNQDNPRALRFYEREGFRRTIGGINAASGLATWTMCWP